jgi:hypothetical protein
LKIQGKLDEFVSFKCEFCNKIFTTKQYLVNHVNFCKYKELKDKLKDKDKKCDIKLKNKDKEILELKNKIEIASKKNNNFSLKNQINNQDMTFKISLENGKTINIGIRSDGYINATELCKAAGKAFADYHKSKQTQDYLKVLSSNMNILILDLINSNVGGNHSGTYVHRKVGYNLAQWLSPSFAVQVSNVLDNLFITGKVELGNEKSNTQLENIYQEKINNLENELENKNNKLKIYETTIFNRKTDYCPIEYYGKDIVYFLKFNIPSHLQDEYISKYPNIDNNGYNCVEFGVSSDIEKRLLSHKRDKKKDGLIFLHAIELNKRYTASKMEFYIKTVVQQLNVKFDYEKKKECFIVNEEQFNIIINKIKEGITRSLSDINEDELNLENVKNLEYLEDEIEDINKNIEMIKYKYDIEKELKIKKMEIITDLFKNKMITIDEYKSMIYM